VAHHFTCCSSITTTAQDAARRIYFLPMENAVAIGCSWFSGRIRPAGREEQVLHAMKGSLWVDDNPNRLTEISGQLMDEVRFGGGFLGHLDKSGTFDVKQEPVRWQSSLGSAAH